MNQQHPTLLLLREKFPSAALDVEQHGDCTVVVVSPQQLTELVRFLRDAPDCAYDQLTDVVGIDYLNHPQPKSGRFAVVYPLLSLIHNRRITLKVYLNESAPELPSLTDIYFGALWPEREAAEMFGIKFTNHPDLRRLLLGDLFEGKHPLRKDYPLKGLGERDSFDIVDHDTA